MRIISKYHDYYDSVQKQGFDNTIVFERVNSVISGEFPIKFEHRIWGASEDSLKFYYPDSYPYVVGRGPKKYELTSLFIGVAGKLYKSLYVNACSPTKVDDKLVYSLEALQTFLDAFDIHIPMKKEIPKYSSLKTVEEFNTYFNYPVDISNWMIENKLAIVAMDRRQFKDKTLEVNPCLKNFDFQKIVDPYTMFQELEQWISGVLTNNPIIPEPSDKEKVGIHGFTEWSFRKHKLDNK